MSKNGAAVGVELFEIHNYLSLQDAVTGILGEVCELLRGYRSRFAIIGGWSPFLLNSSPIQHPGTKDVDILFEEGTKKGELLDIVQSFVGAGFLLSAKHQFQVLRILNVLGTPFVFNVDVLHPTIGNESPELFVDHLELPVPMSSYRDDSFTFKSIVLPYSKFLFDGYIENTTVRCILPNGQECDSTVPLMNEVGTIVTKSSSCGSRKRHRDAFDIYLAIRQARNPSILIDSLQSLKKHNLAVFNTLYEIKRSLNTTRFVDNVSSYLTPPNWCSSLESMVAYEEQKTLIRSEMEQFLEKVGLDPLASNP